MNIVYTKEGLPVDCKYTTLELDTFLVDGHAPITAYCVIENIPITEISSTDQWKELHANLMKNYRERNWDFCENALEHLIGKWNREADTFYVELSQRIKTMREQDPGPDWDGIIRR